MLEAAKSVTKTVCDHILASPLLSIALAPSSICINIFVWMVFIDTVFISPLPTDYDDDRMQRTIATPNVFDPLMISVPFQTEITRNIT